MKFKFTTRELARACGVHERTAQRILATDGIPFKVEGGKRVYFSKDFTPTIEKFLIKHSLMPPQPQNGNSLVPISSQAEAISRPCSQGLSEYHLKDQHVQWCAIIVREALDLPADWRPREWKVQVALRYGISLQTVYKYIKRQEAGGIAAHRHIKKNRGQPKKWDQAALEYGVGLALKRPHRKMSKKAFYKAVCHEAKPRGWAIGEYRSFCSHLNKKLNPLLLALRDGGRRGLDNALPPIVRNYSDLHPFEIVCGDQHKFDFWVQDDETGAIFRVEGYFFIDLRTRLIYGFWLGKRYDSHSIALALRVGCRHFGAFKSVYSDNGKPELSKHVADIINEITLFGVSAAEAIDLPIDLSDQDPEEIAGLAALNHRKAIIRNAKAKMIENFFHHFEAVLRDEFKVPGHVKRLSASGEEQEIDEVEVKRLAERGKLLKFSEFMLVVMKAANYYNQQRPHRGVLKEWAWKPRPREATPLACLMGCYEEGWRPLKISDDALDLAFLPKEKRTVDRGRIRLRTAYADLYEHESLASLHGQEVSIRFDPLDPSYLLVYANSEFICRALPIEYSSMKDKELTKRKIEEKRRLARSYIDEYHRLTWKIPDLTQYSAIPRLEAAATAVREKLETDQSYGNKLLCEPTAEQVEAQIRESEAFETRQGGAVFVEPERSGGRPIFEDKVDRYKFVLDQTKKGKQLSTEDSEFKAEFEGDMMDEDIRDMWAIYREVNGIREQETPGLVKAL